MREPLPTPNATPTRRSLRRWTAGAVLAAAAVLLAPAGLPAATARADEGASGRSLEPQVILYATSWCGWCRKTRALLAELDVAYADLDIEKSPEAAREHREKAGPGAGVPVLDIGGTIVKGYDPAQIRKLVAELKVEETESAR